MSLLVIKNLSKEFYNKIIFKNEEIIINENDKIGLLEKMAQVKQLY